MPRNPTLALLLGLLPLAVGEARGADAFESLHCIKYAQGSGYPADAILFGTDRGKTLDLPMVLCAAKRGAEVVVLDSGFVDQEVGAAWGVVDYAAYGPLFEQIGVRPEDVSLVTLSHLHWDHANGTSAFPNARFALQRRELEFAAGRMPHNKLATLGFQAQDVIALVKLNWEGRVLLPDGDVEDLIPGLDVHLTPGHTRGTMTVCLDVRKRRVCYASDSVYTYRNIEEDIALGLALDLYQSVESYARIRRLVGDGILIPGHEARIFDEPARFGFRRVSDRIVAIVE
jgi:glyoxylase-like metal-dependent hydrolase (beta-lactamase superfamily II)